MPRGGAREGSGAKKDVKRFSERVRKNYENADRYFSRFLAGEDLPLKRITPEMATTALIYGYVYDRMMKQWVRAKVQEAVRLGAQKLRQEALVIRESYSTVEKRDLGPVIGLPKIKEKPEEGTFPVISTRVN